MKDLTAPRTFRPASFPAALRRSAIACLGLLPLLALAGGCSGSSETNNSVTGRVTLRDEPVAGAVEFIYPDKTKGFSIITNGNYTIANLKTGSVKVVVKGGAAKAKQAVAPPPAKGPEMPVLPGTVGTEGVAAPAVYGDEATTPLTYTVKAGKQTHNIELNP